MQRAIRAESGTALVVMAVIIVALVALVGIAIDISSLGSSTAQGRSNARYAALGAIEAYFASDAEGHDAKLAAAQTRLNEIAGLNKVLSAGGEKASQTATAEGGLKVTSGKWFYRLNSGDTNPCNSGQTPPCFVPRTGTETVNAFKISGEMYTNVRTFFAGILGLNSTSVPVEVVSTITPRQGCFIVDLSPSMTRDTHIPEAKHGAAYGFYLRALNTGSSRSWHDDRWDDMSSAYPLRDLGAAVDPTIHYEDDYRSVALLNNNDYSTSGVGSDYRKYHPDPTSSDMTLARLYKADPATYMVDWRRLPGYDGPQPLTAIMNGLKKAVDLFKARSVAGDKMCVIFFDHNLNWPRVIRLTEDYDYIDRILEIRDVGTLMTHTDEASRHGLFPSKDSFTNLLMAITEGERQFREQKLANPGLPVAQFMVLITDGLSNCKACDTLPFPQFDRNGDGKITEYDRHAAEVCASQNITSTYPSGRYMCDNYFWWANEEPCVKNNFSPTDPNGCGWLNTNGNTKIDSSELQQVYAAEYASAQCATPGCQNSYQAYEIATNELKNYVQRTITPQQIPIHVMLVGKHVAPNSIDYSDPENVDKCLADSSLRASGDPTKPYVKGPSPAYPGCTMRHYEGYVTNCGSNAITDFRDMSESKPFLQANLDMYDIARMTRGIWAPLRASDAGCTPGECSPGVRYQDPLCRSMTGQVEGYMEQIMGQNPYTIAFSK